MVYGTFNSIFVELIPKIDETMTWNSFRPISICNFIYKILTKIITKRIKGGLWRCIDLEQFKFLYGRQILDTIATTQQTLHNIKVKKMEALVLKLDLVKAYDRVNWNFLRLVLMHIGVGVEEVNWIMGCVESVNFAILVNGEPISFFRIYMGLRQGFPLSPLLLLLVVEGKHRLIKKEVVDKSIEGVNIKDIIKITHLLFIDDILLIGSGEVEEWRVFINILEGFYVATSMKIILKKYTFLDSNLEEGELQQFRDFFPYNFNLLENGLKYLSYFIKPNNYKSDD